MSVTNDEIYAYLVDLSANIAEQFAQILDAQTENFITLKNILNLEVIPGLTDLSANIAQQFATVNGELALILIEDNLAFTDLSANLTAQNQVTDNLIIVVDEKVTAIGYYLLDLSANLTAQNQVTDSLIIESVIVELNDLKEGLTDGFEKQTNDINTNTNTALSQYTNTINTNTNKSVSTAVDIILNH